MREAVSLLIGSWMLWAHCCKGHRLASRLVTVATGPASWARCWRSWVTHPRSHAVWPLFMLPSTDDPTHVPESGPNPTPARVSVTPRAGLMLGLLVCTVGAVNTPCPALWGGAPTQAET